MKLVQADAAPYAHTAVAARINRSFFIVFRVLTPKIVKSRTDAKPNCMRSGKKKSDRCKRKRVRPGKTFRFTESVVAAPVPKMENDTETAEKRYLCDRMRVLHIPEMPPPGAEVKI